MFLNNKHLNYVSNFSIEVYASQFSGTTSLKKKISRFSDYIPDYACRKTERATTSNNEIIIWSSEIPKKIFSQAESDEEM